MWGRSKNVPYKIDIQKVVGKMLLLQNGYIQNVEKVPRVFMLLTLHIYIM